MKGTHKRRKFLVNKKLQLSYSMTLVLQASVITVFLGACLYWVNKEYLNLFHLIAGEESFPKSAVDTITNDFLLKIVAVLCINAVLLAIIGIYSSHRFAGPVHRLTNYLNSIAKGAKITPVTFRNHDHLKEVVVAFNQMAISLDNKAASDQETIKKIKEKTDGLLKKLKNNPSDNKSLYEAASEIDNLLDSLNIKKSA